MCMFLFLSLRGYPDTISDICISMCMFMFLSFRGSPDNIYLWVHP